MTAILRFDMARLKAGIDVWLCSCGEAVIMGRPCHKCGRTYADALAAKAQRERSEPKKRQKKYREPASSGEFIQSFMFKKGEK